MATLATYVRNSWLHTHNNLYNNTTQIRNPQPQEEKEKTGHILSLVDWIALKASSSGVGLLPLFLFCTQVPSDPTSASRPPNTPNSTIPASASPSRQLLPLA